MTRQHAMSRLPVTPRFPARTGRRRPAGFSLIELLVSMAIGLIVTLAITSVLLRSEGAKRSTTSVNDINQTGAYAAFVVDRAVRSAGSGISQRWHEAFGCRLDASQGASHLLPFDKRFGAGSAFVKVTDATTPLPIRLAPVIIAKGLADTTSAVRGDVLVLMSGAGGRGESPNLVLTPKPLTASTTRLPNTLGYRTGDLLLLADASVAGGCLIQQVQFAGSAIGSTDQFLPLGGTYYTPQGSGTNVDLDDFGISTVAMQLGNAVDNPPQFQLIGVGPNDTLNSHDLLTPFATGTVPDQRLADGVVEMRALYGIDESAAFNGTAVKWIDPTASPSSGYEASVLLDGSTDSRVKLRRIVAIRLGFILRTSLPERPEAPASTLQPAGTSVTLFADTDSPQSRALSATELNYRFRTVEITVPLHNVMLAPP